MLVMKRAVQALCVASSFPWGSAVGRGPGAVGTARGIAAGAILPSSAPRHSAFASPGKSAALAFAPPLSFASQLHARRAAVVIRPSTRMSSTNTNDDDGPPLPQAKNRVALLQLPVTCDKSHNLQTAKEYIAKAQAAGARLCVLPEIWNGPYATSAFPEYAETLPKAGDAPADNGGRWGASSSMLMELAQSTDMYIVGGSIPEICDGKIYNTCLVVDPSGTIIGKHRKVHLFDVDVPGGIRFQESETLSAGEDVTFFDVDPGQSDGLGRVGLGICYDIRFPEYALLLTQVHGCKVLVYPGAFNNVTGPAHWELLQRARAVDGQCFVLTASPARMPPPPEDSDSKYPHYSAWGHSTAVSPWGEVVATCDEKPTMVVADLDMAKVDEMRMAIPTMAQKRHDLYRLVDGDENDNK